MKLVICNWKLNPQSASDAKRLFDATKKITLKQKKTQVIVLPPIAFLQYIVNGYKGTNIEFGAQAISKETEGSHTGEVSALQVRNIGATYTLVGHAERRARGVTNEDVNAKVKSALHAKLDVIVAVGESMQDEEGTYIAYIRKQITTALEGVVSTRFKSITIAYEPVWAIGAATAPDADTIHKMILLVKKIISDAFGSKALKVIKVVYGGSVDESTVEGILAISILDGILLGRASLDPKKLESIITAAEHRA